MVNLTEKEALGVYLLLLERGVGADTTMARLERRIERSLYASRTVGELEDLKGLYRTLPESPADAEGPGGPERAREPRNG